MTLSRDRADHRPEDRSGGDAAIRQDAQVDNRGLGPTAVLQAADGSESQPCRSPSVSTYYSVPSVTASCARPIRAMTRLYLENKRRGGIDRRTVSGPIG